jgi:hypothetical protein
MTLRNPISVFQYKSESIKERLRCKSQKNMLMRAYRVIGVEVGYLYLFSITYGCDNDLIGDLASKHITVK